MAPPLALMSAAVFAAGTVGRVVAKRRAAAQRRAKPQRAFRRVYVDNTDAPFVHGDPADQLAHQHLDGAECDAAHAESSEPRHPYAPAIERVLADLPLPSAVLTPGGGGAPEQPAALEDTPLVWVCDKVGLMAMVGHLAEVPRFAMDLEHSPRAYHGITCLIQISTGAYVCACVCACVCVCVWCLHRPQWGVQLPLLAHRCRCMDAPSSMLSHYGTPYSTPTHHHPPITTHPSPPTHHHPPIATTQATLTTSWTPSRYTTHWRCCWAPSWQTPRSAR